MLTLYPAIQPYATYNISVDNIHNLYIEECGTKDGIPIIYLHGGPGTGCDADNRRFFDPKKYRIILFDQRGSGRSTPHAEIKNNTPQLLVQDLETIRKHCGIEKWTLFGGSWGSTLALLYAQTHPNKVTGMILRGIFLARKKDLNWVCREGGASNIYPDYWQEFTAMFTQRQKNNLIKAYYKILTGKDELARMSVAKAWAKWETVCATLDPCQKIEHRLNDPHIALSLSKIGSHYAVNNYFMEENFILNNMKKIDYIPATIIHGRYDMICPIENAFALHQKWPQSNLMIIRNAGHSSREPGILHAIMHTTNTFL